MRAPRTKPSRGPNHGSPQSTPRRVSSPGDPVYRPVACGTRDSKGYPTDFLPRVCSWVSISRVGLSVPRPRIPPNVPVPQHGQHAPPTQSAQPARRTLHDPPSLEITPPATDLFSRRASCSHRRWSVGRESAPFRDWAQTRRSLWVVIVCGIGGQRTRRTGHVSGPISKEHHDAFPFS